MINTNKLEKILAYICNNYPHKRELTDKRLVQMIYLADWLSTLVYDKQVTEINWYYNHLGPSVPDIYKTAENNPALFKIEENELYDGTVEYIINLKRMRKCCLSQYNLGLDKDSTRILNRVIQGTKHKYWPKMLTLVYNTTPVSRGIRYTNMNLLSYKDLSDYTDDEVVRWSKRFSNKNILFSFR